MLLLLFVLLASANSEYINNDVETELPETSFYKERDPGNAIEDVLTERFVDVTRRAQLQKCDESGQAGDAKHLDNVRCRSHPVILPVKVPTDPRLINQIISPSFVILHRCSGSCDYDESVFTCSAKDSEVINVKVDYLHEQKTCIVPMINETQCACQCVKSKNDCTPKQVWNPKLCSCSCKNKELQKTCPGKGKGDDFIRWDEEKCSCVCAKTWACVNKHEFRDPSNNCKCTARNRRMNVPVPKLKPGEVQLFL